MTKFTFSFFLTVTMLVALAPNIQAQNEKTGEKVGKFFKKVGDKAKETVESVENEVGTARGKDPQKDYVLKSENGVKFIFPYKYPKNAKLTWSGASENSGTGKIAIDFEKSKLLIPRNNTVYITYEGTNSYESNSRPKRFQPTDYVIVAEGDFINGKLIKGKIEYLSGIKYDGALIDWEFDGTGTLTNQLGVKSSGLWKNGRLTKGKIIDSEGKILQEIDHAETFAYKYKDFDFENLFVNAEFGVYGQTSKMNLKTIGSIKNENYQKILLEAIKSKKTVEIKQAIDAGANANYGLDYSQPNLPLTQAIMSDCKPCITELQPYIKDGGTGFEDSNGAVYSPLLAAEKNPTLLKELFTKFNANPNSLYSFNQRAEFTPVIFKVSDLEAFRIFFENGANPYCYEGLLDSKGNSSVTIPLIVSLTKQGKIKLIEFLFEKGFNPISQDKVVEGKYQYVPPFFKFVRDHEGKYGSQIANKMIYFGATWDITLNYGVDKGGTGISEHLITYFIEKGDSKTVEILLKLGAPCREYTINRVGETSEKSMLEDSQSIEITKVLMKCKCE